MRWINIALRRCPCGSLHRRLAWLAYAFGVRLFAIFLASSCAATPPPLMLPLTASVGCLEVSAELVRLGDRGPVLEWHVANICDYAVPVDLTNAQVIAVGPLYERTALEPRDVHGVLAPGWIDGGETSFVRMAYSPAIASRDVAIELELDAFSEMSHRHVVIAVLPPITSAHSSHPSPSHPSPGLGPIGGAP